jgi:DNA-binding phage protein
MTKSSRAVSAVLRPRAMRATKTISSQIANEYRATINNPDPTMLQVALLIRNSNLSPRIIAARCGVSYVCIYRWLAGKTRRPQAITLKFVLRALGYDLKVVPAAGHNSVLRTDNND